MCTGLHVIPAIPEIPGIENVLKNTSLENEKSGIKPRIYHSVDYKFRSELADRSLLILGTGETGMDLAYEAAKAGAKEVVLCTRGGYVVVYFVRTLQTHFVARFLSFPKVLVRIG